MPNFKNMLIMVPLIALFWVAYAGTSTEPLTALASTLSAALTNTGPEIQDAKIIKLTEDVDLKPENIREGVTMFETTGTYKGNRTCKGEGDPNPNLHSNRWCDNQDGTVTDMETGLTWLKKANWKGKQRIYENKVDTLNAHDQVSLLKNGDKDGDFTLNDESEQGDWRLPTRLELEELLNKLREDQKPFTEVQEEYWSSTTDLEDKAFGWLVPVAGDEVYTVKKDEEHDVWPVRGPKWSP